MPGNANKLHIHQKSTFIEEICLYQDNNGAFFPIVLHLQDYF